jgi:CBS domain containing-hemolysin-like protein
VLDIRKSLTATLWVARPLHIFYICTRPAIWLLSNSTNLVLRLFGITSVSEHEIAHSEEELRHIVAESQKSKEVTETEKDILLNALALNDRCARDVMTPRNTVVSLDADDSFEANLKVAIDSKHTRYPLVEGHLDQAIGIIHIKDLLALVGKPQPDLRKIKRELHMVPELMPIDKLLRFCLDKHVHFVLAVDEFGGAAPPGGDRVPARSSSLSACCRCPVMFAGRSWKSVRSVPPALTSTGGRSPSLPRSA